MSALSELVIAGMGVNPWSARGLTQTLEPIGAAGSMRRTVNGELRNLGLTQFQKYRSTISCTDVSVPPLDGVWPGLEVTVDCVAELSYPTATGSAERTVVSGSSYTDGAFTFYRPQLTMLVVGYKLDYDEFQKLHGWQLDLEEV